MYQQVIVALIILLLSSGCMVKDKVPVVFVGTLTGKKSELGIAARRGLLSALKEKHGQNIKVTIRDDKGDPATLGKILKEEIEERGVKFFIGPFTSNLAETTINSIAGKDVLVISPTISTNKVSGIDDNFIRAGAPGALQADEIVKGVEKMQLKKGVVVYDSSNRAYTENVYNRFLSVLKSKGRGIADGFSFSNIKTTQEYADIVRRVLKSKPDFLFVIASALDAAMLCQQIRKHDPKIQLFGSMWSRTDDFIEYAGVGGDGFIAVGEYTAAEDTDEYKEFERNYFSIFGVSPSMVPIYTYDAIGLLIQGIVHAGDNPGAVKKYILSRPIHNGLKEQFEIDQYGDASRKMSLYQVVNGVFVKHEI